MGFSWYVLLSEPRAEYLADVELRKDGFEIFFPRIQTTHPRGGHIDEPLFPGYLFMRCDADSDGWPTFRPAHRIVGWVNFQGIVPTVPDEVIVDLARRLEPNNNSAGLWHRFKPGEKVRVVSGIIDDPAMVIEEAKSPQGRAKVLMDFMGRQVQVQVPWGDLRSVQDQQHESQRPPRRTRGQSRWIRGFGPAAVAQA